MILLEVEGIKYEGFTDISVKKSMDAISGSFSFAVTSDDVKVFPVKNGSECKIWVDGFKVITGYIERLNVSYDSGSHTISVEGRDKTADIIDSTLETNVEFSKKISLVKIIETILSRSGINGIEVISNVLDLRDFNVSEILSGKSGENTFELIEKLCRKRQVLLSSDGDGNIVLQRASIEVLPIYLNNQKNGSFNNIKSASVEYDDTQRFYKVKIISQANPTAFEFTPKNLVSKKGIAFDNEVRNTRRLTLVAENLSDDFTSSQRAIWETNIRRAKSMKYTCTVQSFGYTIDNTTDIWRPNKLVNVLDEFADINGQFLINSVNYNLSISNGSTTILELITKDAYTLQAEQDERDAKANKQGDNLKSGTITLTDLQKLGLKL